MQSIKEQRKKVFTGGLFFGFITGVFAGFITGVFAGFIVAGSYVLSIM